MKHPIIFLIEFLAWLLLVAILATTWAGVKYPDGRTKAYRPTAQDIRPWHNGGDIKFK